jgi:hypothetical protein
MWTVVVLLSWVALHVPFKLLVILS